MKEYQLVVYVGIHGADDVEKHGDIIVCPLNCLHDCVDVLSVDLHGILSDVLYGEYIYPCFLLLGLCFNQLAELLLNVSYILDHGCSSEPTEGIP